MADESGVVVGHDAMRGLAGAGPVTKALTIPEGGELHLAWNLLHTIEIGSDLLVDRLSSSLACELEIPWWGLGRRNGLSDRLAALDVLHHVHHRYGGDHRVEGDDGQNGDKRQGAAAEARDVKVAAEEHFRVAVVVEDLKARTGRALRFLGGLGGGAWGPGEAAHSIEDGCCRDDHNVNLSVYEIRVSCKAQSTRYKLMKRAC